MLVCTRYFLLVFVLGLHASVYPETPQVDSNNLLEEKSLSQNNKIDGTWQGELTINESTTLNVQFIFSYSEGEQSVLINSPDFGGIKNTPSESISVVNNKVKISFPSLSGVFEGSFSGDSLEGEWFQLEDRYPLVLHPYTDYVLTNEDKTLLSGMWSGDWNARGQNLPIELRFDIDAIGFNNIEDGTFIGFLLSPNENRQRHKIDDIRIEDSDLSFRVLSTQMRFTGKIIENRLDGTWTERGTELPFSASKKKVYPPKIKTLGQRIAITSKKNGKMMTLCKEDTFLCFDDKLEKDSKASVFFIETAGFGNIFLRSVENNKYVVAETRGTEALRANREKIGGWGLFNWIDNDDGTFSLLAIVNKKYVAIQQDDNLIANSADNIDISSRFDYVISKGK